MLRELKLKRDFGKTADRFAAWWQREVLDRPPVTIGVESGREPKMPGRPLPATLRDRWLDVEGVVERAVANLEAGEYSVGDRFPQFCANVGPEITATLYGCELGFGESTSWSTPIVHQPADWEQVLQRKPDFGNVYWQTMERMTDYAIEISAGRYVVGMTDLHGNYDILAALRDPQMLCMDLVDCPEVVRKAGRHVAQGFVEAFNRCYAQVARAGFGSTFWAPLYHEGPCYIPSSDFWCMVGPEMARNLILPDIRLEMAPLEKSIFHLDGVQALPHLDLLLELPELDAVQWVYGAGRGPAAKWMEVYRRCVQAGKAIQVQAEGPADALEVLKEIGPKGVWLDVGGSFKSVAEGQAFLREVERISARHGG